MEFSIVAMVFISLMIFGNKTTATTLITGEPKILNATAIPITAATYMVSVHMKYIDMSQGLGAGATCSGAVISQRMIITAASCITNFATTSQQILSPSLFTVLMGTIYTNKKDNNSLEYNVQKVVGYSKFNLTSPMYDIAALFIDGYIPWNWPTVKAIQLNTRNMPIGTNCTVTGWQMKPLATNASPLLSVTVPIMNNSQCSAVPDFSPPSMLCAGYKDVSGVNSCNGSTGNPLVCNGLLTGIVSHYNGCGSTYPGFYGNISEFYTWIIQTNSSFDYDSYGGAMRVFVYSNAKVFISVFIALMLNF